MLSWKMRGLETNVIERHVDLDPRATSPTWICRDWWLLVSSYRMVYIWRRIICFTASSKLGIASYLSCSRDTPDTSTAIPIVLLYSTFLLGGTFTQVSLFFFFVLFLSSSFSRIFFLSLQQTIHISLSFALSRGQPPFILCLALSPFCPFTDVSIFSPLSNILLPWDPISLLWCCSFPHLPFSIFLVPSVSLVSFKFFSLLGITRCCEKYRLFRQRISIQRFLKLDVLSCKFKRHVIAVTVQSGFYRPEFSRNTSLIAGT